MSIQLRRQADYHSTAGLAMSRLSQSALKALTLSLLVQALAAPLIARATDTPPDVTQATPRADEQAFLQAIANLESNQGAYAPGLSEQLLSLGLALQSQGRHTEAVTLFKRGVHLARVNEGLYSEEQIPLLQGEIASHVALGQYANADERQRYLYRVQVRSMNSGQPRAMALMQQANWQLNAYYLGLGSQSYSRLMNMWDLYRLALNDIISREGQSSAQLLPPLRGMLKAQYLISGYDPQSESSSHGSADDMGARQDLNRFNAYRAQSFEKGSAVIKAIYDIEQNQEQPHAAAETLVMLGDWQLWHDEKQRAWESYQNAIAELAELDDAQVRMDQLMGSPVPLPDMSGVRPLPPEVAPEQGNILLQFGVSAKGRVIDMKRLDEPGEGRANGNRLMRKLRKTKFRPRFEAGQRVRTEKLVKAYELK